MEKTVKKISLSAMVFTYLFAGISHFTQSAYFRALEPSFLPRPEFLVGLTGGVEIFLAFFLAMSQTRQWACYGILFLWSMAIPLNLYVLVVGGAGIPLPYWQLAAMIPFHILLMLWAIWHCGPEKKGLKDRVVRSEAVK